MSSYFFNNINTQYRAWTELKWDKSGTAVRLCIRTENVVITYRTSIVHLARLYFVILHMLVMLQSLDPRVGENGNNYAVYILNTYFETETTNFVEGARLKPSNQRRTYKPGNAMLNFVRQGNSTQMDTFQPRPTWITASTCTSSTQRKSRKAAA